MVLPCGMRSRTPTAGLPRRVLTLPAELLRQEIPLSRAPVTDEAPAEIVDDVLLPLVHGTPKARTFGGDGTGP
ncbi:hypothetical protein [Streptomyces sp. S.PB5]|uniref:hypothetical protein n=1 Tax=Streptomyces sp. S.PB5 TaxID=3020844 RepID=UPI0025B1C6D9|nr:hypothetical protein [Streptomyces sp. S.PB5]MDN3024897.1 hypothetical protein [Streptomyces sp. S.PB5]